MATCKDEIKISFDAKLWKAGRLLYINLIFWGLGFSLAIFCSMFGFNTSSVNLLKKVMKYL